ncbi:class I SAM-dependent methyltransferase [Heyndrickxia coagulans]|uniref:Methyltransferase domain-containing protein n=1 Tax=Heyndrickxia coagulans DSM 1 = ATCC 7050 TaxID=1121088 RepID=A0A8B4C0I6_HEYCO|nr:class I SAM-dependent methyltransferase [Heyndrickxia coagulans]AJH77974.1 met-10+ like-family protein [Heyndrickxia coagulans DSM 1 = ATCC 7050]MCR2847581.1 class I SAM-dependent methyltransferase [Heyndrickxia coagulans]MDR4225376.1 class I SAM-dependent methyltransferase [Heyndrickxia coagulans DSM 1 = ATCC 7050]MED4405256.1 class I SAM-dependent methyltransferase [Heyndrickxia coagulans]MED4495211.1 class I SAM-dependent methyltransferase [Heyndrickxia coagulans]
MSHHRFDPEKASLLLNPERKEKLPPDQILALLELKKGDIVADLGSGNGFFTIPIAQKTETTVYAVDIEPKMLDGLKAYASQEGVTTIRPIVSDLTEMAIANQAVDKIFSSLVMHEISDLEKAIQEMRRILRPNGKLLILDWEAVDMNEGPPLSVRIPSDKLKAVFEGQGFYVEKRKINEGIYALKMSMLEK